MSTQLRWINEDYDILRWVEAMTAVNSLLEKTMRNPWLTKDTQVREKETKSRVLQYNIPAETPLCIKKDSEQVRLAKEQIKQQIEPQMEIDDPPTYSTIRDSTPNLVAAQEFRQDVKVKPLVEEQNDLTNYTGDARSTTSISSLEPRKNTPMHRPADPGDRLLYFNKWRQALWQSLDDYGWSADFYEDTQLKWLLDRISEETGLTGHKSDRKLMEFLVKETKCCLKVNRRKIQNLQG